MITEKLRQIQNWVPLLSGGDVPDRLVVRPDDMWPGDGEAGRLLCDGQFTLDGEVRALHGDCWEPTGVSQRWLDHLQGFRWLRDLRAVGTAAARQQAQALIENWAAQYAKPSAQAWRADLMGERISLWIAHYDFFGADDVDDFDDVFFASLVKQSRQLARILPQTDMSTLAGLRAVKGLLYAALALEGQDEWRALAMEHLQRGLEAQILADGSHVSRNVFTLLLALKVLLEIRAALQAGGQVVPDFLHMAITKMVPAIRFFRYGDRHFGLFQGALQGSLEFIDSVLAQAGVRGKKVEALPDGGYYKTVLGRSLLMLDAGKAQAHTAPLSFELAHGKDRVFVNCGSHVSDTNWQDVLSGPAAHSGVTIDGPALQGGYRVVGFKAENGADFGFMQASHDGFIATHGVIHQRSLYLCNDGHDLRGEDIFTAMSKDGGPVHPQVMSVRFHVHPRVMVSMIQDGQAALLRLRNGVGWRFQQVGGFRLKLEDSVYCGEAGQPPRKSQQLVIESAIGQDQQQMAIKWALQREGL